LPPQGEAWGTGRRPNRRCERSRKYFLNYSRRPLRKQRRCQSLVQKKKNARKRILLSPKARGQPETSTGGGERQGERKGRKHRKREHSEKNRPNGRQLEESVAGPGGFLPKGDLKWTRGSEANFDRKVPEGKKRRQ